MNQNRNPDKLSVGVVGFEVGGWFVIKWGGEVLLFL
jgi:hypothetical protein